MGILDGVSSRTDGETPTAAELNELLEELVVLFNGGLPSSVLTWPMVAQGSIDMNTHSLVNVGSIGGVTTVNADRTLKQAVDLVNTAGGGIIAIDSDFVAETETTPIVVTADGVTIMGHGNSSVIHCVDLAASGVSIQVTGDNFMMRDVKVTCASSVANLTHLVHIDGVSGYAVDNMVFDTPKKPALKLGGATASYDGNISRVRGNDAATSFIEVSHTRRSSISQCVFTEAGTAAITLPSGNLCIYTTISNNVVLNTGGGAAIDGGPTVGGGNFSELTVSNNILSCGTSDALDAGYFTNFTVTGNVIYGDVTYNGQNSVFSGNTVYGDMVATGTSRANIVGCYISGTFDVTDATCARSTFNSNSVNGHTTFPTTSGFDVVTGNRVNASLFILTTDVAVFDNNYADGGTY